MWMPWPHSRPITPASLRLVSEQHINKEAPGPLAQLIRVGHTAHFVLFGMSVTFLLLSWLGAWLVSSANIGQEK